MNGPILGKTYGQRNNFDKKRIQVISTFNGIGSFSEGMKQLGVNFNMNTVCEIDKSANETYYKNNLKKTHYNDINDMVKGQLVNDKADILIQTPPCQSFSMCGKRLGLESDNGNLFLTSIKLQKQLDSNIVIYENVKGLVSHDKSIGEYKSLINKNFGKKTIGHTLHRIETLLLEDTRYNYYWEVLNSCDLGLPQNRERIFIVGIKKELDTGFTFPEKRDLDFTVEDILEENVDKSYYFKNVSNHKSELTFQKKRPNRIHTIRKYTTMKYEKSRRIYSPYVSPCIVCNNESKFLINGRIRFLTPTENKRIHGFREGFEFVGSKTQRLKQLGNTVSPGVYKLLVGEILSSTTLNYSVNNTTYSKTLRKEVC